jgi:hypothetical protein
MARTFTLWSDEMIMEEAKKYEYLNDFRKYSKNACEAANRKGKDYFKKVTSHMMYLRELGKTDEYLIKIAEQYDRAIDFKKDKPKDYGLCMFRKLNSKIKYKKGRWGRSLSPEEVLSLASQYDSASHLIKNNRRIYRLVERYGLHKEVKYKEGLVGNKFRRMVYVYEFSDNFFYCGLTFNERDRHNRHMSAGPVFNHMKKNNLIPIKKKISEYISSEEASKLEEKTRLLYLNNGWSQLNRVRAGGLGGIKEKWTEARIRKIASQYQYPSYFKTKHLGAYTMAKEMGIYDDVVKHMILPHKKEDVIKLSKQFFCVKDFKRKHSDIYSVLFAKGWYDDIFANHLRHCRIIILNELTGIYYYGYDDAHNHCEINIPLHEFIRQVRGDRGKKNTTNFKIV